MKMIASMLLVLSTLTSVASQALAAPDNDNNATNIQDLERQNRAGNPGGQ